MNKEENFPNKSLSWEEYRKYLAHEYSKGEEHEFEKAASRSLFDEEAVDGLEKYAVSSLTGDLNELADKLQRRNMLHGAKTVKKKMPIWPIAATVIVLVMSVVIVLLLRGGNDETVQLAKNEVVRAVEEVQVPEEAELETKIVSADTIVVEEELSVTSTKVASPEQSVKVITAKVQAPPERTDVEEQTKTSIREKVVVEKPSNTSPATAVTVKPITKIEEKQPEVNTSSVPKEEIVKQKVELNVQLAKVVGDVKKATIVEPDLKEAEIEVKEVAELKDAIVKEDEPKAVLYATALEPEVGLRDYKRELKKYLKKNKFVSKGVLMFELVVDEEGKPLNVKVIKAPDIGTLKAVEVYILKGGNWSVKQGEQKISKHTIDL